MATIYQLANTATGNVILYIARNWAPDHTEN